jgi:hypothetical protein
MGVKPLDSAERDWRRGYDLDILEWFAASFIVVGVDRSRQRGVDLCTIRIADGVIYNGQRGD